MRVGGSRGKDSEKGAGRTLAGHLGDLRHSADRLSPAIEGLPPRKWAAQVVMRSGRVIAAAGIPRLRLMEVSSPTSTSVWSPPSRTSPRTPRPGSSAPSSPSGHQGVAAVRVRDTDNGEKWSIGAAADPGLTVVGPPARAARPGQRPLRLRGSERAAGAAPAGAAATS